MAMAHWKRWDQLDNVFRASMCAEGDGYYEEMLADRDGARADFLAAARGGTVFRYVVFEQRVGDTPRVAEYVYTCRDGEADALIARKMATEARYSPAGYHLGGSHQPWKVLEISESTYETAGAAKRAGRAKFPNK